MANFSAELRKLGVLQGQRHVLPILALKVAKAAKARHIDESSALDVYVDYFKASSRLKTIDPYDNGVKANVSKLRQIIKARDPDLLERVMKAHSRLTLEGKVKPLYAAMVAACRAKNAGKDVSSKAAVARIVRL